MIRIIACLFLCLLLAPDVVSQNKLYQKGYVVKTNGDTLAGYIARLDDYSISRKIDFKQDLSKKAEVSTFYPADLSAFFLETDSIKFYQVEYLNSKADEKVPEKRFAPLLLSGYTKLYKLKLSAEETNIIFEPNNNIVFVAEKDNRFYTLRQTEKMEVYKYSLDKQYIEVLKEIFADCKTVDAKMIEQTALSEGDFLKIFFEYNNCMRPGEQGIVNKIKPKTIVKHMVGASYVWGGTYDANKLNGFSLGFYVDFSNTAISRNITLLAGFEYFNTSGNYLKLGVVDVAAKFKKNGFRAPLLATYHIYGKSFSPFISLGLTPYYLVNDYNYGSKLELVLSGGIGLTISDRVSVAYNYDDIGALLITFSKKGNHFEALKVMVRLK